MPRSHAISPAIPLLEPLEPRALLSYTFFGPGSPLAPLPTPPTYDATNNSVLADFDGDGIADLATASRNTISFAKGLADGSFEDYRTTTIGAPVGFISAGRFDGTGRASLIAVGTRGGSILYRRPNPGFRLRGIAFDPAAHADINGASAGAFVLTATLDITDYQQSGTLPTPVVADMLSGWRDEFAINMLLPSGASHVSVFSFKNRTTIIRSADISGFAGYGLAAGDVLGAGKAQLFSSLGWFVGDRLGGVYMQYYTRISMAAPTANAANWSVTPIRTFPVRDLTFALGDWDNDAHTDIVALATREATAQNRADSRLWLIRSLGSGAFAAPTALTDRHIVADWSAAPPTYAAGRPALAGLTDLNGDGRLDALVTSLSVFVYRTNAYSLLPTALIQTPSGAAEIVRVPTPIAGHDGTAPSPPFTVQITPPASPSGSPTLLVSNTGILRAAIAPQPPTILSFNAAIVSPTANPTTPVAQFTARAFDSDALRGGSIQRVEFYIDANNDGQIDANDTHLGDATSPDAALFYTLTLPPDPAWGAPGAFIPILARAVDDANVFSTPAPFDLQLL